MNSPSDPIAAVARPDPCPYGVVAGQARREGDAMLVGLGAHACPGEALATAIAEVGVAHLLAAGVEPGRLGERVACRPPANTRIPLLGEAA